MTELLRVQHVSKRFGGVIAVQDVNFTMRQGEILGLMGANGAGKTTLFSMIAGNVATTSGQIHFEGKLVPARPDLACRLGIARTFQIVRPFPGMTVLENCLIGILYGSGRQKNLQAARKTCRTLLDELGLGAQTDKPAASLTLAGRKRLEIARALSTHPKLLLLDEVLAGLNATEVNEALSLIQQLKQHYGLSIIIIEHVMKVLMRMSDRIVVMHDGHQLMEGTPAEVGNDPRVIRAYLGEQKNVRAA